MAGELSVGTLSGRIELEDNLTPAITRVGESLKDLEGKFGSLGQRIHEESTAFLAAQLSFEAIKEAAHKVVEEFGLLFIHGSVVEDVTKNFERLTDQAGLLSAELLGSLKESTHGVIDDFQLMKRVNEDLSAGAKVTNDQFNLLAQGSFALAKAQGGSVTQTFEDLNQAMVTGRVRGVAYLTGKIDIASAEEKFALAAHHSTDELTEEGKIEAGREALLAKVAERLAEVGDQEDSLKNRVEQGKASWANFEDELDRTVATSPIIADAFNHIMKGVEDAFGTTQQEIIHQLVRVIEDATVKAEDLSLGLIRAAKLVYDFRDGIEVLGVAVVTYTGLSITMNIAQIAFNSSLTALSFTTIPNAILSLDLMAGAITSFLGPVGIATVAVTGMYAAFKLGQTQPVSDFFQNIGLMLLGYNAQERESMIATDHATQAALENANAHKEAAAVVDTHTKALAHANDEHKNSAAYFKESASAVKEYAKAWEELSTVGETYLETIQGIDPEVLKSVRYYLEAGAAVGTVAKAFPELTEAQATAVETMVKTNQRIGTEITKAWEEYFKVVNSASHDSVQLQINEAYQLAQVRIEEIERTKSYSVEAEMVIWRTAEQTANNIIAKTLEEDVHTRDHFVMLADQARIAYEFAQDHADRYSADWIQKLRDTADAAKITADTWTTAFDDALGKVDAQIGKTTDSLKQLSAAKDALTETYSPNTIPTADSLTQAAQRPGSFLGFGTGQMPVGLTSIANLPWPHRASGGDVRAGRPYVVGERQPEMFVPNTDGMIVPNAPGGGSDGTLIVNVSGVWDPRTVDDMTDRISKKLLNRTGRKFGRAS